MGSLLKFSFTYKKSCAAIASLNHASSIGKKIMLSFTSLYILNLGFLFQQLMHDYSNEQKESKLRQWQIGQFY